MSNLPGTNLFAKFSATTEIALTRQNGTLAILSSGTGTIDTTANTYEHGSIMIMRDTAGTASPIFINTGSSASPVFSVLSVNGQGAHPNTAAINSTATATAAQVVTGYITSTSASPTTITLPTGTLLGAALGATQGTTLDLFIDNTGGASTVTIAVAVNGILSSAATAGAGANFGLLTIPAGVTGIGRFSLTFSSATAYVFSRTA